MINNDPMYLLRRIISGSLIFYSKKICKVFQRGGCDMMNKKMTQLISRVIIGLLVFSILASFIIPMLG